MSHPRRLAIDEAQRLPELFPALRQAVDSRKGAGRFVLTGSASPSLFRSVSESLAGRIGLLELTPFRSVELKKEPQRRARWFWGGYPPVHARRTQRFRHEWLDAYVSTFLERDLPSYGLRLPRARLRTLWTMLTHVHGNLLNVSDLARSLGVSSHTVDGDLDVLEQTFMIRRLRPYHANIQKRLTKSPKIYLRDTGLLHFLAGLRKPAELETWARRGASFEGLVIEELIAAAAERAVRPEPWFWRTHAGAEVDLLVVHGRRILAVEVKLGATVRARDVAGLRSCMKDLKLRHAMVIYTGEEQRKMGGGISLVPWVSIAKGDYELPI
jgi:predicted AAA+ superfamily ATPase